MKSLSIKNREAEVLKRKQNHENEVVGRVALYNDQGSRKGLDDDSSNRSSSGSATSNSESCAQFGCADASDLTGFSVTISMFVSLSMLYPCLLLQSSFFP